MGSIGKNGRTSDAAGHAEHISEVRACTHQQVLHHVAESFAPLDDAVVQDPQTGLDENYVGSFASHVHRADTEMPTSAA